MPSDYPIALTPWGSDTRISQAEWYLGVALYHEGVYCGEVFMLGWDIEICLSIPPSQL